MNFPRSPIQKTMPTVGEDDLECSRPRSDSEGFRGPMTKMFQRFRHRSATMTGKEPKVSPTYGENVNFRKTLKAIAQVTANSSMGKREILDPFNAAVLFRDSRGLPMVDPFLDRCMQQFDVDENLVYSKFFKLHRCYDLMPISGKVVVFDTHLPAKQAFQALVENEVRAAPLWSSSCQRFVGMLTITDFIKILCQWSSRPEREPFELETMQIEAWRSILGLDSLPFIWISPSETLYNAVRTLVKHRIHRLPVIDPKSGNVLYVFTHKRALRFFFLYLRDLPGPSMLYKTLQELNIGTYSNVEIAYADTPVREALRVFINRHISALPIVDRDQRLIDIYAKFDVINLAAEKTYDNLEMTIREATHYRNQWFEGVHCCKLSETFLTVMERIARTEVHRLIVVDDDEHVLGILSLSDIFTTLLLLKEVARDAPSGPAADVYSAPMSDVFVKILESDESSVADDKRKLELRGDLYRGELQTEVPQILVTAPSPMRKTKIDTAFSFSVVELEPQEETVREIHIDLESNRSGSTMDPTMHGKTTAVNKEDVTGIHGKNVGGDEGFGFPEKDRQTVHQPRGRLAKAELGESLEILGVETTQGSLDAVPTLVAFEATETHVYNK